MSPAKPSLEVVAQECRDFPAQFLSLHLATCNSDGEPEASYAAYVEHEASYYIYVSELSTHTSNLARTARCAVMFIESEAAAKHLFARRRLTMQCSAVECRRGSAEFELMLDRFVEKFGGFMSMMRKLADFHLYRLQPQSGGYVAGFAQAYSLGGVALSEIRHRIEQGHRSPDKQTSAAMDAQVQ